MGKNQIPQDVIENLKQCHKDQNSDDPSFDCVLDKITFSL